MRKCRVAIAAPVLAEAKARMGLLPGVSA